ncbi:MAG TPA: 50S ribosomal protein L35 [Kiritimatiellia bacterium]|nr:50S ribosomal protein L35 [Kiritimatiellia bacterium]HRZ13405.1 50S ribosomal protein L35 [Kiritimatiellia bacterium]HSA18955.1 50S ribosomal protein L35 [Kiritimatiellia bacterium]
MAGKYKTRKAVSKRFHKTAGGVIKHACGSRSHLLGHKSRKRKRQLRAGSTVSSADYGRISRGLPL